MRRSIALPWGSSADDAAVGREHGLRDVGAGAPAALKSHGEAAQVAVGVAAQGREHAGTADRAVHALQRLDGVARRDKAGDGGSSYRRARALR